MFSRAMSKLVGDRRSCTAIYTQDSSRNIIDLMHIHRQSAFLFGRDRVVSVHLNTLLHRALY
jgi:hypothetical protein